MNRRDFFKQSGLAIAAVAAFSGDDAIAAKNKGTISISGKRPPVGERKFVSEAVETQIEQIKIFIADQELRQMFEICYPNTLDTTVSYEEINGRPDTYVITGDIDAMWLRDSTAEVTPFLPLINSDAKLKKMIQGLINRQIKFVLLDPYANSFLKNPTDQTIWQSDQPTPKPGVHERKWEVDSLCYVARLSYGYYKQTNDSSLFDADWQKAMRLIVDTFAVEQRKNGESPYYFVRKTETVGDAPPHKGKGNPLKSVGMIASMFRPSDDATILPFLVPSNLFAVQSLKQLHEIFEAKLNDQIFAAKCLKLAAEVETAINKYAIAAHEDFGKIYAYEVDGFGNKLFMDDANVPSLMSLPYLGAVTSETSAVYQNTRRFLLSSNNPFFLRGRAGEGAASPHTGRENIWPMGIILRAMTSENNQEIRKCVQLLKNTHAGTGFMHESFHKDDASKFTRPWFAWANTLFGELIVKIHNDRPQLLKESF